jgi:hypothetical protein
MGEASGAAAREHEAHAGTVLGAASRADLVRRLGKGLRAGCGKAEGRKRQYRNLLQLHGLVVDVGESGMQTCGTKKDGRRLLGSECGRPFSENASGRSIRLMIAREAAH